MNQKKRIEELRSELDAANMALEQAKRAKETMDQELKGYEVELSINESSLQALEVLFCHILLILVGNYIFTFFEEFPYHV